MDIALAPVSVPCSFGSVQAELILEPSVEMLFHLLGDALIFVESNSFSIAVKFFNWTATYLFSSDVIFKYGLFYLSAKEAELKGFKFVDFHIDESALTKKKSGVFGLISNCNTSSKRELAIKELSKYMNVTVGGKCALDIKDKDICPLGSNCAEIYGQYPFYFAVENSVCKDYVTEKYWDRTSVPSIPIVMRRKIYESSNMPPHSFIAMDDYDSPRAMAEHLIKLETDKKAYAEYFKWRRGIWTAAPWNAPGYRNGFCRLCERLWEEDPQEKVIDDVWAWFDAESQCEKDEFVKAWVRN
ncbi:fucosyl transferase [Oesophagostomum dentatum]|uniref:Fucosyltransferase n=1 Tax=Oesophagostomum dentatum TaxID=61180 RepID=A0A0B1TML6_OESDE|nr:fucosyl transferase [Oesophagostomum dentatum]